MRQLQAVSEYFRSCLTRKFVLTMVLANIAVTAALGWELLERDRANLDYNRLTRARGVADLLAAGASSDSSRDSSELLRLAEAALEVKSVEGVVFRDAADQVLLVRGTGPMPTMAAEDAQRVTRTEEAFLASAPLVLDERRIGSVQVRLSRADIVEAQRELGILSLIYGLAIVLLGGLVAYLTARSVTERLRKVATVADRFRLGEHDLRFVDTQPDEVGAVSRGMNAMLDTITASERSLNEVFRIAQIGSWRFRPSTDRLEWSDAVRRILGLASSEPPLTVARFLEFVAPRDRARLQNLLRSGEAGALVSFNFSVPRGKGGGIICWAEAQVETCPETGERSLVGICQDVTERETGAAQLRQAQKMEAVGQLTGGLAHDFNNLLAIMIGNLDLLEEQNAGNEEARECVSEALAAALRGSELTRQLLAFSRRQPLSPKKVNVNKLVGEMSSLWRRTLGENIEVSVRLDDQLWPTRADPSQLESAVLNLVINARDAMPDGGTLTVETCNISIDKNDWHDEEGEVQPGQYSVIAVSDTGCGMRPEVVAKAIEPFFTTKAVGQGSGLGLSMVYGFARQSGGTVHIYSEPGVGTTVRLYLPRQGEAEAGGVVEKPARSPERGVETVLVVEDNDSVRRVAERQLRELGYSVVAAANGPEALKLLDEGLKPDLIFTDVVMPGGMNGFELGKLARERRPGVKLLHTSGFTRPAEREPAEIRDALPVLTKPYRKADLARRVRSLLDTPVSMN